MNKRLGILSAAAALLFVVVVAGAFMLGRATGPALTAAVQSTALPARSLPDVVKAEGAAASTFTKPQQDEIAAIVREYLMANPELVRDAIAALEQKQQNEQNEQQSKAVAENRDKLLNSANQAVIGNPDAKVTLVEFFDYNCTYCRRAQADMRKLLEDKDLKVILKEFPVLGPGSVEAARIAIGVQRVAPEKYGEFHDKLLSDNAPASEARALAMARSLGLDADKIAAASKDEAVGKNIDEVYALANTLGLTGTPSYVIGDEVVVGAVGYDALKAKIDSVRACGATAC